MRNAYGDKRDEVNHFLTELKDHIDGGGKIQFVDRVETQQTFIELEITGKVFIDEVYSLNIGNYSAGPDEDRDRKNGNIWVFGKEINGYECYIKIKLYNIGGTDFYKCISFHKSSHQMDYPLKK